MQKSPSLNNVVTLNFDTSWASRNLKEVVQEYPINARFQQRQMQEKEEKLLRLYENQQQRAFERVGRGSAGSNTSVGSTGGGKVRQMFDERRQKAGVDKSYPLEPLKVKQNIERKSSVDRVRPNNRNITTNRVSVAKSTVQKSVSHTRNGKPVVNKSEAIQKIYANDNGREMYQENRYTNDDDENAFATQNLIDMMNRNNIHENLEDEILPQIEFDEMDSFVAEKLNNVGGKLPSQNGRVLKNIVPIKSDVAVTNGVVKNGTKTSVKKSPVKAVTLIQNKQTPSKPFLSSRSGTSSSSSHSSPSGTPIKMSKKPSTQTSPSTDRPSMRQTPKNTGSAVNRDDLDKCKFCGRRFASDRIAVHENVCGKTSHKQRKTYDAFKHRVGGTDLESYAKKSKTTNKKGVKQSSVSGVSQTKNNWRRTHEEFISTIRSAKMTQAHLAKGGKLSDLPPPPPSSNPDYVACPHCGRRFNESAAERHIPKCASFVFNKSKPGQQKLKR